MKYAISCALLVVFAACRVDAPPEAEKAARKAADGAKQVTATVKQEAQEFAKSPTGKQIAAGAKELGESAEGVARDAAVAAGKGIENAGKKIQEKAKPGDQ